MEEKSFAKKILGFFIKEDETAPTTAKQVITPTQAATPVPKQESAATVFVPNAAGTGVIDKKFVDHFVQVLEKSNLPGPDYFEFMNALKSLSGLGLSEDKQYQAAWASFQAMGNVSDTSLLTSTAGQYVTLLSNDRNGFLKDAETAITERVGGLQNELKKMQTDNETMAKQIVDLQNKINENNEKIKQTSNGIEEQSSKITTNKNNYEITYSSFIEQIQGDIAKIKQYLAP